MEPATAESVATATAGLAIDSSLPLWFKPELFLEPDFSPTAYVSDLKRYVSRAQYPLSLPRSVALACDSPRAACGRGTCCMADAAPCAAGLSVPPPPAAATDRRRRCCCSHPCPPRCLASPAAGAARDPQQRAALPPGCSQEQVGRGGCWPAICFTACWPLVSRQRCSRAG